MPSKHMLPKGKRRQSVRAEYRAQRDAATDETAATPSTPELVCEGAGTRIFAASDSAAGTRLDAFLVQAIPDISRARAQMLIDAGQVRVNGSPAKASHKLRAGEQVTVEGEPRPEPLHATPEDIPLDILYEDQHLAVINKPAGMMVHAGAGSSDDARSRGTLVNALLHRMQSLSAGGDPLRPGIVHRLDKETSGAIVVAKDDLTHRKLSELFSSRRVHKTYIALAHGNLAKDDVTVDLPIARDLVRRTRMTTRRADGRHAVSHIHVLERLSTPYGPFTLAEVRIETGRTHQIRVHLQSLGNPIVGDTLYGAPKALQRRPPDTRLTDRTHEDDPPELGRNFLHAAHLEFVHPRTGSTVAADAPMPDELSRFLSWLRKHAN